MADIPLIFETGSTASPSQRADQERPGLREEIVARAGIEPATFRFSEGIAPAEMR